MKKKYNDESDYCSNWTTKKLKAEAKAYYYLINEAQCFSTKDLITYEVILQELEKRGIIPQTALVFE